MPAVLAVMQPTASEHWSQPPTPTMEHTSLVLFCWYIASFMLPVRRQYQRISTWSPRHWCYIVSVLLLLLYVLTHRLLSFICTVLDVWMMSYM